MKPFEPVHQTLLGQLVIYTLFVFLLLMASLFLIAFFIARVPMVALNLLSSFLTGAAQFLTPSSTGNGIFLLFVLGWAIWRYVPVTVRHGLEKERCLGFGKASANLWYAVTWKGKWLVGASEILTDYRHLPTRSDVFQTTGPAVVPMHVPRQMRTLYFGPMNEMASPNSRRRYRMMDTPTNKVFKLLMLEMRKQYATRQLHALNRTVMEMQPMRAGLPPPSQVRAMTASTNASSGGG